MLAKEDFNDDKKDAGEIGAGHTVTALYEVVPVGVQVAAAGSSEVDPLEYQDPPPAPAKPADEPKPTPGAGAPAAGGKSKSQDLLMLKLRYKAPDGHESKLLKYPVVDNTQSIGAAGDDCELAAAVAAFGMQLRRSSYKGTTSYAMILELAEGGVGEDKEGYRREFVELVKKAQGLGR
jgi:Ca-activated chloride channel family protein